MYPQHNYFLSYKTHGGRVPAGLYPSPTGLSYSICPSPPISAVISSIRSSGNGGRHSGFMAIDISFIGLSSAATRFELSFPHRLQRWIIAHSPDSHRFHNTAAGGRPVSRLLIYMKTAQAVRAVIAVAASCSCRNYRPPAVFAGKAVMAGMGFVVSFFIFLSLVFTVHFFLSPSSAKCFCCTSNQDNKKDNSRKR